MFTIATCVINKIYDIICYLILLRWETVLLGICLGKGFWSLVYWSAPGPCLCSSFEGQMWYTTLRGRHINYHTQISLEIWNLFVWFLKFVQSLLHCLFFTTSDTTSLHNKFMTITLPFIIHSVFYLQIVAISCFNYTYIEGVNAIGFY